MNEQPNVIRSIGLPGFDQRLDIRMIVNACPLNADFCKLSHIRLFDNGIQYVAMTNGTQEPEYAYLNYTYEVIRTEMQDVYARQSVLGRHLLTIYL